MADDKVTTSRPERWVAHLALASFAYYLVTFAFELGFFWRIGLRYLSAFGLAEHTTHAAGYILGGLGGFLFLYLVGYALPISAMLSGLLPAEAETQTPRESSKGRTGLLAIASATPLFVILGFGLVTALVSAFSDLSPVTLWGVLAMLAVLAHFVGEMLIPKRALWPFFATLAAALGPVALGQLVFDKENASRSPAQTMLIGGRRVQGRVIFIGTERLLVRIGEQFYLTDTERHSVISIPRERQ